MSMIKTVNMCFNEINPQVRYVQHITLNPSVPPDAKMLYDYRITYVHGGKGMIEVEDSSFQCRKGALFFWGPAIKYAVHRDALDPLVLINLHFDFTADHKDKKITPPAALIQNFNPEMITEKVEFADMKCFNSPFYIKDYYQGESLLLKVAEEYRLQRIFYLQHINGTLLTFLMSLARYMINDKDSARNNNDTAEQIIKYIHRHYDKPMTNKDIAQVFNFHPNYLNRLILKYTGTSLHQYVLNVKVQKAYERLHASSESITKIAQELGFSDISHFSKVFKGKLGRNPNEVR